MNRQEEIKAAASVDDAEWTDKNVSWDLVVKLWNLATKTTIAQVNSEWEIIK